MYKPPLSVYFVWHPANIATVKPIVDYCSKLLQKDPSKPFSHAISIPVFYRTILQKGLPLAIEPLSTKTMIFTFIGEDVVADKGWADYNEKLPDKNGFKVIHIALDKMAFNLKGNINGVNLIRAYGFEQKYLKEYLFISIAHEIYRYVLNENFKENNVGTDTALKIFLSHAKDGKQGIKLAKALKDFIDNSAMNKFFDATDIAPGYQFNSEIEENIKKSTIVAIHSDIYSSRYWCQIEILCAKEHDRPIVAVDCLEEFEDRRFPFAANIPGVHVNLNCGVEEVEKEDLLHVLILTLLETIRFFYSQLLLKEYQNIKWIPSDAKILSRPPEVSDINKILLMESNSDKIKKKYTSIVYPEPPLYDEELTFLKGLGFIINTPLTAGNILITGKKIGISISEPSEEELVEIGQNISHLILLSQDLARHLLARKAILIYGGDLRKNGFTEFLFNEAQILQSRLQSDDIYLKNYIAWPIYLKDTKEVTTWKARYRNIAEMIELMPPEDEYVKNLIINDKAFLPHNTTQDLFVWSRCLTEMRNKMIEDCDARICAGGKNKGFTGKMPGVLEEIKITIEKKKPLFLLGGFGGITSKVCDLIISKGKSIPEELTVNWQIENNQGYNALLKFASNKKYDYYQDYKAINRLIANTTPSDLLNNGLNEKENEILFKTRFIDEALHLILRGLNKSGL